MSSNASTAENVPTFAGHPAGLFVLFFAEMWERFSYYGMRALLVFYMTKGFLGYNDDTAYDVYGAYTSLVYATPFIGGVLADRLLGARKAVVLGGLLMAAGHLVMTVEDKSAFYLALALLICGNGFFKPNISTIVGALYPEGSHKRDSGFTLFYMGINLGAAMAPLLCGYIGETYGWHYGFGLATVGMLIGLAIFAAPGGVAQVLIVGGALAGSVIMLWTQLGDTMMLAVNTPVGIALLVAGAVAFLALGRGPLPASAGAPPDPAALRQRVAGMPLEYLVYTVTLVSVPVIAFVVQRTEVATIVLSVFGVGALGWILVEAFRGTNKERDRLIFIIIMMFFSMLFWAFFELAGSAINNFTDRNIDRVMETTSVSQADVGKTIEVAPSQALLGYEVGGSVVTLGRLEELEKAGTPVSVTLTPAHVGMGLDGGEVKASVFQAANPIFILLFGLAFSALWGWLGNRNLEPNTPVKFSLGLLQLAAGFGVLWWGAQTANSVGMVGMGWLLFAYLLHTTGELCLSPVGLSMVTRLSPGRVVSMVMGAWFLATAFSQQLSSVIAKLTSAGGEGEGGGTAAIPAPIETVHVYGDVFGQVGLIAAGAGLVLLIASPLLKRMMHEDEAAAPSRGGH